MLSITTLKRLAVRGQNSQDKNADAFTASGFKVVQEEVNDFEAMYLEMVADGRGVDVGVVKATYGNGKIMSAQRALDCGMIDSIKTQSGQVGQNNASFTAQSETNLNAQSEQQLTANGGEVMNKTELKAKHPELYAEIKNEGITAGKAEGIEAGKKAEQERVSAFSELGEASGDQAACNGLH